MTAIELSDKAVDAIRDRAQEVLGDDSEDRGRAAEVLVALDQRTDHGSVDFDDATLAWLDEDRQEMRRSVEERATGLVDGLEVDWEGSTGDAHYVWALEEVAARLAQAADPTLNRAPILEPGPIDGYEDLEDVAGIRAERQRLEAWWDVLEQPPADHPGWAVVDEIFERAESIGAFRRKVLELIAAGTVDPVDAANAAVAGLSKVTL